jgi:hypothetical protein
VLCQPRGQARMVMMLDTSIISTHLECRHGGLPVSFH